MINFNITKQLQWRDVAVRTAFILVTVFAIVWFMPRDIRFTFDVEEGKPWPYSDLTAAVDFNVIKKKEVLEKERQEALKDYVPYYTFHEEVARRQATLFKQRWDAAHTELSDDYKVLILNRLNDLYERGIINTVVQQGNDTSRTVRSVFKNTVRTISRVLTPKQAYEQLMQDAALRQCGDALKELDLNEIIVPNLIYDSIYSQSELKELMGNVATSSQYIQRGQKIISRGDIVDNARHQVLISYQHELAKGNDKSKSGRILVGRLIYVFICILMFTIYLGTYRKDYLNHGIRSAGMLYALIIIFSLITSLLVGHGMFHVYIIPYAIVPIFIRVFMDSRTAAMAHLTLIIICASMLQRPLEFISVEVIGGMAAIFTVRELSSRSQLLWTALVFILAATATRFAIYLIHQGELDLSKFDTSDYLYLLFCGLVVFCAYPLLYVVEKTFGFASDITLVELSNPNKDLLRRMSEEAPGTFNHSIQVGNLAAEIARKLDANAQLVRTGALYHDIGKIQNPIYFTENQSGGISPHEHLSYIDSAQYIISHVTEGLKLADKHHLPRQIRDLIATHHGQGKAKYFYIKYKNEHPDEPVDDLLFTYPGPNPFTKEQAILMMADAVEAASRSLPDYTEQSIRTLVERIIDGQVQDGFFRECPITFRDIQYSKTVLIEKLKTIYHTRISYPEEKK